MKCPYCNKEFSSEVMPMHILRCPKKPKPKESTTTTDEGGTQEQGK